MRGEPRRQTGILMLKSIRLVHDKASEETDQRVEQGLIRVDDALKLAAVRAELSYLNILEQRRETNVASLRRLKEACDALRGEGSEAGGISTSRRA